MDNNKNAEIEDYKLAVHMPASPGPMAKYLPGFAEGAYLMRRAFLPHPTKDAEAAIPRKYVELIIIAIEIGAGRGGGGNPGVSHTRSAVRHAGVTPQEIAQVVAIAAYLCGMPAQVDHGRTCIQVAEEEYEKLEGNQ